MNDIRSSDTHSSQQERVILITGASSGIGKATALYLAEKAQQQQQLKQQQQNGNDVNSTTNNNNIQCICTALVLFARRLEPLQATERQLHAKYPSNGMLQTLIVTGDARIPRDNERAVQAALDKFGGLHGMFINAGVFRGHQPLIDMADDDIDLLLDT